MLCQALTDAVAMVERIEDTVSIEKFVFLTQRSAGRTLVTHAAEKLLGLRLKQGDILSSTAALATPAPRCLAFHRARTQYGTL